MKRLKFLLPILLFSSFSYTTIAENVELKTKTDSISYAVGILSSEGIAQNYLLNQTSGPAYDAFIKGFNDGLANRDSISEKYAIGLQAGIFLIKEVENSFGEVSEHALKEGFLSNLGKKSLLISSSEAQSILEKYFMTDQAGETLSVEENEENKIIGEQFLVENKAQKGVITTPSGLQYKVIKKGKGKVIGENQKVKVHYTGYLIDGTKFDSSVDRNTPFEFNTSGGVIEGWLEAVKKMKVGDKWTVYIPYQLGYGAQDMGVIPPFSTLIFDIEVLEVVK